MRVGTYLFVMVGLMVLFQLVGLVGISGQILTQLNLIENPEDISLLQFFLTSLGVLAGIEAAAIVVGLYTKSSPESFLLVGYATTLLYFVADIISVSTYALANYPNTWVSSIILMVTIPVAIGYVHSVLSWWGGKSG